MQSQNCYMKCVHRTFFYRSYICRSEMLSGANVVVKSSFRFAFAYQYRELCNELSFVLFHFNLYP